MKKLRNFVITLAASTTILIGLQPTNAEASSHTIPKSYRGTWYEYDGNDSFIKLILKKDKIKRTEISNGWYKSKGEQKHNYYLFKNKNFPDGMSIWTKKMKIQGKYQKVLVTYVRMLHFSVYTKKPVKHNYSYELTGKKAENYQNYIGK